MLFFKTKTTKNKQQKNTFLLIYAICTPSRIQLSQRKEPPYCSSPSGSPFFSSHIILFYFHLILFSSPTTYGQELLQLHMRLVYYNLPILHVLQCNPLFHTQFLHHKQRVESIIVGETNRRHSTPSVWALPELALLCWEHHPDQYIS